MSADHSSFICDDQNTCGSIAHDSHHEGAPYFTPYDKFTFQCGIWQVCQAEPNSFMSCSCNTDCLSYNPPSNRRYFNEPINRTGQRRFDAAGREAEDNVNLPVVLSWDNVPGWASSSYSALIGGPRNLGEGKAAAYILSNGESDCRQDTNYEKTGPKGPKSYRIQIQDTAATGDGTSNLNLSEHQKNDHKEIADGKQAFYEVLNVNAFNSRDNGGECFFNNNSVYRWRVTACCDEYGLECAPFPTDWWTFKTSAAPEPLGIIDKNNTGSPAQDPDWAGKDHLKNVDVCSAKLLWCKARLVDNDGDRFSKKYNTAQLKYAANYQMRVNFSENWSLNLFDTTPGTALSWQSILMDKLRNNPIAQAFNQIASQALLNLDHNNKESCHYLEKQKDGTCKPETVSFGTGEILKERFRPFFSAAERKSQNRNLFTGDMKGNLTYSWETKVCFNVSDGKKGDKDFPFCTGYNNANYGQKWKFSGSVAKIDAPILQNPKDNPGRSNKELVGSGETIQWTTPCGANSFLYDIKENGQSIFQSDGTSDGGRRTTTSQVLITLTDKTPTQEKDPQKVNLQINKFYSWRVQSCWPSLPVGDINLICTNEWSGPFYFFTTGRPPADGSMKVADTAPNAELSWESVAGAKSYRVKVIGSAAPKDEVVTNAHQFAFAYPDSGEPYKWQVKTCADDRGTVCGDWSARKTFNSGDFAKPWNLSPANTINQLPYALSWSSNAKYFLITATFSGTADSSCDPAWFNSEYEKKKVHGNTMAIQTKASGGSQFCAGDYWFKVTPCFDAECEHLSANSSEEKFDIRDPDQKKTGFMVCGQKSNDPDTSYNEKEPCEIRHLVLTIKVIVDYITFKLALIILPILVLITGYFFYTAQGDPKIIGTMKDAWKKIGIGYAILIFAWMIVCALMQIAGYSARASWFNII